MTTVAPNKMRELKPQELIKCCEEIFATFNPGKVTPDSYADECLEKWRLDPENDDAVFIKQVFYGCLRYNKLIKTLLASFFHVNASSASRSDANLFTVFCYLILLRLEELTFEQFRRLVLSQDPLKMATLIQFVFSEQKLNEYCKDQWLQLYDVQYVEDLLKTTVDWAPQVEELLQILEETAFAKKKGKEEELENWMGAGRQTVTTVVKPFTLSQPKPKPAPPPEEPPPKYKAKAAPPVTKGLTKEQQALEAAKEANRKRLEARNATGGVFRLRVLERPSNLDKVQAEVEAQRSEESKYIPIKARPVPAAPSVPVKLNAAAILREDAVYRKRMEEQARLIKAYETELRDSSTFESWREEMQAMDSERRAAEIERRRQEMADAQQAAIDARRNKVAENQETAAELKDEMRELMARRQAELAVLEEINRAKKEQIVEERKGVKVAQERLVSEKRQKAEELQQEKAELSRRLAEERAAEQARREDLIRQLRAIDAVPKEKVAIFDPTAASGVGLLEEMSIAELRERLALAKERRAEQQQQQRAEILKQKQQKESLLLSKAASISRLRDMQAAQRAMRKAAAEGERAQSEQASREKREQDMLDLHARLEKKRSGKQAEEARLLAEEKAIKFEQERQAAGAAAVEAKKYAGLRAVAERGAKESQAQNQAEFGLAEETKSKEQRQRLAVTRSRERQKKVMSEEYDAKLEKFRAEDQAATKALAQELQANVASERARKATLKADLAATNPYSAAMASPLKDRSTLLSTLAAQQKPRNVLHMPEPEDFKL